ncbi:hypothetical protein PC110_g529 [Phytophthora cactorum]|uniref:Uncharacterized protein n=1 Tax=Phytophthora cactorum TaxID=29920 RepID=A0A329T5W7_9STRA|nr:hypothetical protein PC110_g529 [Phytophthora cactorum]
MCKEHNVQIVVYADEQRSEQESKDLEAQELEDLLSIVNVFVARRNGTKAEILRRLRREQARKEGDPAQRDEDQAQSYSGAESLAQEDVRDTSSNLKQDDCYKLSKKDLAEKYRGVSQKHSLAQYLPDYHLEVPKEVMNETYRDFTKALDSSLALYKSLKERDEKTSFPCLTSKSRKDKTTSVAIQAMSVSSPVAGIFHILPTNFGLKRDEGFKVREAIPEMNNSIRLQMTREPKFYACIPRVKVFPEMQSNRV